MPARPAKRTTSPGKPAAARQQAAEDTVWAGPPDHPGRGDLPMAEQPEQNASPHRAGGHVDRGDGRGWVLDDEQE
jgi:hypothetical protein